MKNEKTGLGLRWQTRLPARRQTAASASVAARTKIGRRGEALTQRLERDWTPPVIRADFVLPTIGEAVRKVTGDA